MWDYYLVKKQTPKYDKGYTTKIIIPITIEYFIRPLLFNLILGLILLAARFSKVRTPNRQYKSPKHTKNNSLNISGFEYPLLIPDIAKTIINTANMALSLLQKSNSLLISALIIFSFKIFI